MTHDNLECNPQTTMIWALIYTNPISLILNTPIPPFQKIDPVLNQGYGWYFIFGGWDW